jgi:hypothetical protein
MSKPGDLTQYELRAQLRELFEFATGKKYEEQSDTKVLDGIEEAIIALRAKVQALEYRKK